LPVIAVIYKSATVGLELKVMITIYNQVPSSLDVFHAGFVYGLIHGWNAEKSLCLGAWAAAQVSLQLGGRSGIPTLDALRKKSENCP